MAIDNRYAYVDDDDPTIGRQAAAYRAHRELRGEKARRQRALVRIEDDLKEKQDDLVLLFNRCHEIMRTLSSDQLSSGERDSLCVRLQRAEAEIELLRPRIARMQKEAQTLRARLR